MRRGRLGLVVTLPQLGMIERLEHYLTIGATDSSGQNCRIALGDDANQILDAADIALRIHDRELDRERLGNLFARLQLDLVFVQGEAKHVRGQQDTGRQQR